MTEQFSDESKLKVKERVKMLVRNLAVKLAVISIAGVSIET